MPAPASRSTAPRTRGACRTTSRPPSVVTSSRRSGTGHASSGRTRSATATMASVTAISRFSLMPSRRRSSSTSRSWMWRRSSRRCTVMPSAPAASATSAASTGSGYSTRRACRRVATWSTLTPRRSTGRNVAYRGKPVEKHDRSRPGPGRLTARGPRFDARGRRPHSRRPDVELRPEVAKMRSMDLHRPSGRSRLGLSLAVVTMLLWGILPLALKITLRSMDAYTITWYRFLASALLLGSVLAHRRRLPPLGLLEASHWALLGVATAFLAANYLCYLVGLDHTSPANSQV